MSVKKWGTRTVSLFFVLCLLNVILWTSGAAFADDITAPSFLDLAEQRQLHMNPVWQALLHSDKESNLINDPDFLLSLPSYSLQNELALSIQKLFYDVNAPAQLCRFPARAYWIAQQLDKEEPNLQHCDELQNFINRAPLDNLYLVYASENLTQPSSMMGHILLKFDGITVEGKIAEHSISFFTELRGINVPKIIFDSLISGKTGYYALSPYVGKRDYYLKGEQRNIWEYQIRLTGAQKKLLQYHLWELKDTRLTYLFTSYNCATLTNFILSLIEPEMLNQVKGWVSPLDVVKASERTDMIEATVVYPSEKWKIRMLQEIDLSVDASQVKNIVDRRSWPELVDGGSSEQLFIKKELARSYINFQAAGGEISFQDQADQLSAVDQLVSDKDESFIVDLAEYKTPSKAPADSQLYAGLSRIEYDNYVKVGFLPAAHYLHDDNSQYFSENELRLADLSLLVSVDSGAVKLDEFQFYSMTSLVPYDRFTGGLSGRFAFGVEPHFDDELERKQSGYIKGGLGFSAQPHSDLLVYGLAGAGAGVRRDTSYLYGEYEFGMVINEVFDMKTTLSVGRVFNQLASRKARTDYKLTQAKRFNDAWVLVFDFWKKRNSLTDQVEYQLTLNHLY